MKVFGGLCRQKCEFKKVSHNTYIGALHLQKKPPTGETLSYSPQLYLHYSSDMHWAELLSGVSNVFANPRWLAYTSTAW
jgi:hypothetical protein